MHRLLLFLMLLCFLNSTQAQNLTGKWVGYFTTSAGITYPYEIQIQDQGNQNYIATTITKFSSKSLAKASAIVYLSKKDQLVSIIETKFDQLLISPNMQACLMSNHLDYTNENGHEKMHGNYNANSISGSTDCGSGKVYLIKEFEVVVNKPSNAIKNNKVVKLELPKNIVEKQIEKKDTLKNIVTKNVVELPHETMPVKKPIDTPIKSIPDPVVVKKKFQQIPWVLISRDNKLLKKVITKHSKISIGLIDNGSFDNDSLSVYDNNVLLLDRIKLSYKAIHFDLNFDEKNKEHTIILVANKDGKSQINSSLMSIKDESVVDEFYVNPNIKMNNKIVIQYQSNP